MNHTFNPRRIMTDKEMLMRKDYTVKVTSNEGKEKKHVMDCYRNALTKVMHCMNPSVHMIVIKEADDNRYSGGLQRWDREREVDGNDWEECNVDDMMVLGKIVEVIFIDIDGDQASTAATVARKKAKHHWWSLLSHMGRYAEYLKNDTGESSWANPLLLKRLVGEMALVQALAEICDHKELHQQPTKFPFLKSGKNSKVTLAAMTEYLEGDFNDDPVLAVMTLKLKEAVEAMTVEGKSEYMRSHEFSMSWRTIRYQWQDLVAF